MIYPIPREKRWPPLPDVTPKAILRPPLRRAPCSSRFDRRRGPDELTPSQAKRSTTMRCRNCKAFGHKTRTCQRYLFLTNTYLFSTDFTPSDVWTIGLKTFHFISESNSNWITSFHFG